jgi:HNH endonuclease
MAGSTGADPEGRCREVEPRADGAGEAAPDGPTRGPLPQLVADLEAFVEGLDPQAVDGDAALEMFELLTRATNVADAGRAILAHRVDECRVHRRTGHLSAGHLLAAVAGSTVTKGLEVVETGRRLSRQPEVDRAFRTGGLSFDQASAIARGAAADASCGRGLLELAGHESLQALRDEATRMEAAAENDRVGRRERQRAARTFRSGLDTDGMAWGRYRLPPELGAALASRIEAETDRLAREAYRKGVAEARERYAADAVANLVLGESDLAGARSEVVVMVDLDALRRARTAGDEVCVIPDFGAVPAELPRRLVDGDAFVTAVVREGTRVHAVRRLGRRIPAELRTALTVEHVLRDGGVRCAVAGCDRSRVEWDHIEPVSRGGPTSMANLQPLCAAHHAKKTEEQTGRGPIGARDGHDPP